MRVRLEEGAVGKVVAAAELLRELQQMICHAAYTIDVIISSSRVIALDGSHRSPKASLDRSAAVSPAANEVSILVSIVGNRHSGVFNI